MFALVVIGIFLAACLTSIISKQRVALLISEAELAISDLATEMETAIRGKELRATPEALELLQEMRRRSVSGLSFFNLAVLLYAALHIRGTAPSTQTLPLEVQAYDQRLSRIYLSLLRKRHTIMFFVMDMMPAWDIEREAELSHLIQLQYRMA